MNIKTPFRKLQKHHLPFYLFLFLLFSNYILNVSFVIQHSINTQQQLSITFLCIGFIVTILFVACKYSNPGLLTPIIDTDNNNYMFQILLRYKTSQICFDCKIVKPKRSRHCEVCDSCICVYDHHCPWVANCIGAQNYWIFFTFLIFLMLFMTFTIAFQLVNLVETNWKQSQSPLNTIKICCQIYSLAISSIFIIPLIFLLFSDYGSNSEHA